MYGNGNNEKAHPLNETKEKITCQNTSAPTASAAKPTRH